MKKQQTQEILRQQLDRRLTELQLPNIPHNGWIRTIRKSLGMSQEQLAKKLNITKQALSRIEKAEKNRTVSVSTLYRIAEVLGCEVKIIFTPKKSFEEYIKEKATNVARNIVGMTNKHMHIENQDTNEDFQDKRIMELALEMIKSGDKRIWD